MRKLLPVLALWAASFSLASPAQDLFDQASFYVEFYYNGPARLNLKDLTRRYQLELDRACAQQKETCPYDQAVPVIQRMIEELQDNHTYYMSPEALRSTRESRQGNAPSRTLRIGITHVAIPGSRDRLIVDVVEGGPADEAGLAYGDRIIAVNGRLLNELPDENQAAQFLVQAVQTGRPVVLTILRGPERQRLEFTLTGREINLARFPSLKIRPGGVAVLRIPDFDAQGQVGRRVHELVREAQQKGARAMILELRGNSGGLLNEMIISAAAFLDEAYVALADRYQVERTEFRVRDGRITITRNGRSESTSLPFLARWRGPLAVLIDNNTASGGEYLASAIQRARVAPLIGVPTLGIGNTTTRPFNLINGGAISISYNRAYFADGSPYPERAVPDIVAETSIEQLANTGRDLPFEKALEALGIRSANP
ncbi:MAG: S41 family peptidase [Meiothermus sp.]|uniref:S41 family peptidase n=1 Tax=Meiothermus sp. TaxID=1955249 RepID=UPI0025ED5AD2|nr:S41 family peptidase [Meiothermus sp.]MCS7059218.1 S41 family peptidase [Meiothermus sp.]MCS7194135.1 S41 family peptidase [Meiothermus sp.]MDW8091557.1 S41 family peptidase [Meiothermus sp.]MDW8482625.1 S41 family peptidase [Meiothermus sp.]